MVMTRRRRDEEEAKCRSMIKKCIPFKLAGRSLRGGGLNASHGVTWFRRHMLGQGAFASVYSATSRSKSPVVFLDDNGVNSIMPSEFAVKSAEISVSSSLRSEMEILSDLNSSSYVVRCFGDEITKSGDGKLYYNLLLEKCCGGSLASRIRNSGGIGLPENEVRRYTRDIVLGLCYIHGRGYVHCDIKPDNILLVPTGSEGFRAKIGDLGLAKIAYIEDDEGCSGVRGTWGYMSPELVASKMQRWLSDIWALGCVVIEMISGKLVWSCQQSEGLPGQISEQVKDFVEKCLDRDINERWSALMLLYHPFIISEDGDW